MPPAHELPKPSRPLNSPPVVAQPVENNAVLIRIARHKN